MNKLVLLIAVLAITMVSCNNQSKKQEVVPAPEENILMDSHSSEDALEWVGVYEGTMPCKDCDGIKTVIELKEGNTYVAEYTYLKKSTNENPFTETGTFSWDVLGSTITLESGTQESQYQVAENELILLDSKGDVKMGEKEDLYILKKKM